MNEQKYNKIIERLSLSIIKVITTFLLIPVVLIWLTPLAYWQALIITILTITIYKQIKRYVGRQ
jgi:hypothetical protein